MLIRHPWAGFSLRGGWNLEAYTKMISDSDTRLLVERILELSPPSFWTYYIHYDAACQVGLVILDSFTGLIELDRDVVIAGIILHDIGVEDPHEVTGAYWVEQVAKTYYPMCNKVEKICGCIRKHSGRWGTYPPSTPEEYIVHISDYIASNLIA